MSPTPSPRTEARLRRLYVRYQDVRDESRARGDQLALELLAAKEQHGYTVRALGEAIGMKTTTLQDFLKRAKQLREGG